MPIENYNPKAFAEDMAKNASSALPSDLSDEQKQFIIKTLLSFLNMAGEALNNDPNLSQIFDADKAYMTTQFIGEYVFHKLIDAIKGGVPEEHWGNVAQNIAMVVFETVKQGIANNAPQEQLVDAVRQQVEGVYQKTINDLVDAGQMSLDIAQQALSTSNLDQWSEKQQQNTPETAPTGEDPQSAPDDKKTVKLACIALVLKSLKPEQIDKILSQMPPEEAENIYKIMHVPDLDKQIDQEMLNETLHQLKAFLPSEEDDEIDFSEPQNIPGFEEIKSLTEKYLEKEINSAILFERKKIQNFVKYCVKDKQREALSIEFSPQVATIIYKYINKKLSA